MEAHDAITLPLPGEAATARLGAALARRAQTGDVLLLAGDLGTGKTTLARAFITEAAARAGRAPETVPSPTFTLVQTYDATEPPVWHLDLYRLADPGELDYLGLLDMLGPGCAAVVVPAFLQV